MEEEEGEEEGNVQDEEMSLVGLVDNIIGLTTKRDGAIYPRCARIVEGLWMTLGLKIFWIL